MAIAEAHPSDQPALAAVPGVGAAKARRYGEALLAAIAGPMA